MSSLSRHQDECSSTPVLSPISRVAQRTNNSTVHFSWAMLWLKRAWQPLGKQLVDLVLAGCAASCRNDPLE
jgi:hypothetical protein